MKFNNIDELINFLKKISLEKNWLYNEIEKRFELIKFYDCNKIDSNEAKEIALLYLLAKLYCKHTSEEIDMLLDSFHINCEYLKQKKLISSKYINLMLTDFDELDQDDYIIISKIIPKEYNEGEKEREKILSDELTFQDIKNGLLDVDNLKQELHDSIKVLSNV